MGKKYNNLISTTAGFNYASEQPLDDREVVQSYSDLAELIDNYMSYEGIEVYVVDDKKSYKLIDGSWKAIATEEYVNSSLANTSIKDGAGLNSALQKTASLDEYVAKYHDTMVAYLISQGMPQVEAEASADTLLKQTFANEFGISSDDQIPNVVDGDQSSAFGAANKIYGIGDFASGLNNTVGVKGNPLAAQGATTFGIGNTNTGRGTLVAGENLVNNGSHSIVGGHKSSIKIGGFEDQVDQENCSKMFDALVSQDLLTSYDENTEWTWDGNHSDSTKNFVFNGYISEDASRLNTVFGSSVTTGYGTTTFGDQNVNSGQYNFIHGLSNFVISHPGDPLDTPATKAVGFHNFIYGARNTIFSKDGWACLFNHVIGQNNQIFNSNYSNVSGESNIIGRELGTYRSNVNVHGYENIVDGKSILVLGDNNRVKITDGKGLLLNGDSNTVGETIHYSTVIGDNNLVRNEKYATAIGNHLKLVEGKDHTQHRTALGKYNVDNKDAMFMIGNGTSDTDTGRSNAFEVLKEGRAKIYGTPEEPNDVIRMVEYDNLNEAKVNKSGDTITGALTLPNSPTTPDTWTSPSERFSNRITANGQYEVVDGSIALVEKINGSTILLDGNQKHAYFKGIKSIGKNLFDDNLFLRVNNWTALKDDVYSGLVSDIYNTYKTSNGGFFGKGLNITEQMTISFDCYNTPQVEGSGIQGFGIGFNYTDGTGTFKYIPWGKNFQHYVVTSTKGKVIDSIAVGYSYNGTTYIKNLTINFGEEIPYEKYVCDFYELDNPVELGEYDYIDPQEGNLVKATDINVIDGTNKKVNTSSAQDAVYLYSYTQPGPTRHINQNPIVSAGWASGTWGRVDNEVNNFTATHGVYLANTGATTHLLWFRKASYIDSNTGQQVISDYPFTEEDVSTADGVNAYLASHPLTVCSELETPTVESIDIPKSYTVWNKGAEIVVQGDIDNSICGAMPKISQTYSIHENPTEAANKGYVNNGLAKKLDKTGGTITGSLTVERSTDTALSALVVKNGDVAYGLTYDASDEAYKLGQGTVGDDNSFEFKEGEGNPICLRDDSESLVNGEILIWDATNNKLVKSGHTLESILSRIEALEAK